MAVILCYMITEFRSFRGILRNSGWRPTVRPTVFRTKIQPKKSSFPHYTFVSCYSQRKSALQVPQLESEHSICATLCGHLNNSWTLASFWLVETPDSVIRDTLRPWSFVQDLRRDQIRGWWWW